MDPTVPRPCVHRQKSRRCYTDRVSRGLFSSLPKFRRGAFGLFILAAIVSALLADQPIAQQLTLTPSMLLSGEALWAPLTANFVFQDGELAYLLGTLFIQWFMGSELEGFWGIRKYLLLVIGCGVAGHLVSVALALFIPDVAATTVGGTTAMDLAAVAAFAVVFGKRPLRLLGALPLSSRGLAILVIVLSVVGPLARGAPWPVVLPWIVAMLSAVLVTTQPWRRMRDSGKLGGSRKKRKSHLRVVPPDPELLN
jgi:membrane associated rhomboid family serine protease